MVPDESLTIRERAIAAWPPAWGGQNQGDILVSLSYDVDRPWRELSKKDWDWILFTEEQPAAPSCVLATEPSQMMWKLQSHLMWHLRSLRRFSFD